MKKEIVTKPKTVLALCVAATLIAPFALAQAAEAGAMIASYGSGYHVPSETLEYVGPALAGEGTDVSISGDGRYTVFESNERLTTDAEGAERHVYRRTVSDGSTQLVSTHARSTGAHGASYGASISADGRFIAFVTTDADVYASDESSAAGTQIVLKDMQEGSVTLVTSRRPEPVETLVATPGSDYRGENGSPFISADGDHIAFVSTAIGVNSKGVGTTSTATVEVFDRSTGDVTNATSGFGADGSAEPASGASLSPALSADGRFLVYSSQAGNLGVPQTKEAVTSHSHVYRLDRTTGRSTLISGSAGDSADDLTKADGDATKPSISADGTKVAFLSTSTNLLGAQDIPKVTAGKDAYVRDVAAGETHRVSLEQRDVAVPTADEESTSSATVHRSLSWHETLGASSARIAADGQSVVLSSMAPLLTSVGRCFGCQQYIDDNDAMDVYSVQLFPNGMPQAVHPLSARRTAEDGDPASGLLYVQGSTSGEGDSIADGATPATADGRTVVFGSLADNLRGWDSSRLVTPGDSSYADREKLLPHSVPSDNPTMWIPHYRDGGFPGTSDPKVRLFIVNSNAFSTYLHPSLEAATTLRNQESATVAYDTRASRLPKLTEQRALTRLSASFDRSTVAAGTSVTYRATVHADTSGSGVVQFDLDAFSFAGDFTVPSGWKRVADDLPGVATFTAAHQRAGDDASFVVSLKELDTALPRTARAVAESNGVIQSTAIPVQPAEPVCADTGTGVRIAISGTASFVKGIQCLAGSSTVSASAAHGVVSVSSAGILAFTPDSSYRGTESIRVIATDSGGRVSTSASVSVEVVLPPLVQNDEYSAHSGVPLEVDLQHGMLANDVLPSDRSSWHVQEGYPPNHGTVKINDNTGAFVYTPEPGFSGDATFRYRASNPDLHSDSDIATVTVHVL